MRRRSIAVLLAILTGPFSWLFSLGRDSWKAAVGLALNINTALFCWDGYRAMIAGGTLGNGEVNPDNYGILYLLFAAIIMIIIWLITWAWAVVDAIAKKTNDTSLNPIKRKTAIIIAIFFGAWTWLYSYRYSCWKLATGLIISYGLFIISILANNDILLQARALITLIVWALAIVDAALLKKFNSQSISPPPATEAGYSKQ